MVLPYVRRCCASIHTTIGKSTSYWAVAGNVSVGNLAKFLPFVLEQIQTSKRQYLLLHSLKEVSTVTSLVVVIVLSSQECITKRLIDTKHF